VVITIFEVPEHLHGTGGGAMDHTRWAIAAAAALLLAPAARADDTKRETAATSSQPAGSEYTTGGRSAAGESNVDPVQGAEARAAADQGSGAPAGATAGPAETSGSAVGSGAAPGSGVARESASTSSAGATATTTGSEEKKPSKHDNTDLIQKLWSSNVVEIKAAEVAKDRAQSEGVKDFAERMEKDHGEMRDQLAELAEERNLKLDDDAALGPHKSHFESMEKLEGARFDRHYTQMMVKHHDKSKKDVKAALQRAKQSGDQKLTAVLQQAQTKIDQHHQLARSLDKNKGQRMGRRASDSAATAGARTEQGAERAGAKVEAGAEKAGSKIERGAERTGDAAERAGEKTEEKAGEAKDAVQRETR
jgi:putative membrane protein